MSKSTAPRFTAADLLAHAIKNGLPPPDGLCAPSTVAAPVAASVAETASTQRAAITKGVVRQLKEMNGTERAFMAIQEARIRRGELAACTWEGLTFLLPGQVRYKVDFVLRYPDDRREFIETKSGKIWPQDLVRFKVAAGCWGWLGEFQLWQGKRGQFTRIR